MRKFGLGVLFAAFIAATKVLKSPPQRAAKEGLAKATAQSRNARRRMCMGGNSFLKQSTTEGIER